MGRIDDAFKRLQQQKKKGFIPFVTAGDPDLDSTRALLIELAAAGATIIELGVPFSDPMADGPVIQRASERALKHGFGLQAVLDMAARAREKISTPIVLFSYFNPLLHFGIEKLAKAANRAGIDGILVTDLAPEEADSFALELRAQGLDMIFLVAPTSTDVRLNLVVQKASGFIYAVSRAGVTGKQDAISAEARNLVMRLRRCTDLPIAVGFGISSAEQVRDVQNYADAVVVGSAIVAEIEQLSGDPQLVAKVGEFARRLIGGAHG